YYIASEAGTVSASSTGGVVYSLDGGTATTSATLDSSADENSDGAFVVREGETETFTLSVTVDPVASGSFRVQLEEVWYSDDTDGLNGESYEPTPASNFRTKSQSIV